MVEFQNFILLEYQPDEVLSSQILGFALQNMYSHAREETLEKPVGVLQHHCGGWRSHHHRWWMSHITVWKPRGSKSLREFHISHYAICVGSDDNTDNFRGKILHLEFSVLFPDLVLCQ